MKCRLWFRTLLGAALAVLVGCQASSEDVSRPHSHERAEPTETGGGEGRPTGDDHDEGSRDILDLLFGADVSMEDEPILDGAGRADKHYSFTPPQTFSLVSGEDEMVTLYPYCNAVGGEFRVQLVGTDDYVTGPCDTGRAYGFGLPDTFFTNGKLDIEVSVVPSGVPMELLILRKVNDEGA